MSAQIPVGVCSWVDGLPSFGAPCNFEVLDSHAFGGRRGLTWTVAHPCFGVTLLVVVTESNTLMCPPNSSGCTPFLPPLEGRFNLGDGVSRFGVAL